MNEINNTDRSMNSGDESFVEVNESVNPEDNLIDALEQRIENLRREDEESKKRIEDLYHRIELASKASEIQQAKDSESFLLRVKAAMVFVLVVVLAFVLVNLTMPGVFERLISSWYSVGALISAFVLGFVIILLPQQKRSLDDTFLEIDNSFIQRSEKSETVTSIKGNIVNVGIGRRTEELKVKVDEGERVEDFPRQILGGSTEFEFCISEIIEYLGGHIKLAESKASKLLDKGTTYLRRGLYFYIGSIVVWQIWGHFVEFDGLVIAGMISTSIAFVIIEFLAAWFLKQYRSFVDSSMAYMRVQSFFNRYLLLYFAALEFGDDEEGANLAKNELLRAMSLEIKWPDLKDVNANDFNYMIEAMGSMHTSFEKLKGVFKSETKKRK